MKISSLLGTSGHWKRIGREDRWEFRSRTTKERIWDPDIYSKYFSQVSSINRRKVRKISSTLLLLKAFAVSEVIAVRQHAGLMPLICSKTTPNILKKLPGSVLYV